MIVNHRLPCLAIFSASQEKSAIRAKVIVHFHHDFEVFKACISDQDAPFPRHVLRSDDSTVDDAPFTPAFVLADSAMTRLRADMPALEGVTIENGLSGASSAAGVIKVPASSTERENF